MDRCIFKKWLLKASVVLLVLHLYGCKDIFESDISEAQMVVLSPIEAFETEENVVLFWWQKLEGANSYHLQLVEGSIDSPTAFLLDSNFVSNRFEFPITTGDYEWRVKGVNEGYETEWVSARFSVKGTSDLTSKTVVLTQTIDTIFTNEDSIAIEWYPIDSVDHYKVEIRNGSQTGGLVNSFTTSSTGTNIQITNEGEYAVGIRAENSKSVSAYTWQQLFQDKTAPSQPNLGFPISTDVLGDSTFTFSWTRIAGTGSAEFDSIIVATNNTFQNVIIRAQAQSKTYRDSTGVGQFYWRVKSVDKVGNKTYSSVENFIVN